MSWLRALAGAFYSRPLYRDVAARWSAFRAIGLLALALALGWVLEVAVLQRRAVEWAEGDADRFIERLPPLALRGGELEADPPGPHVYHEDEASGPVLLVIDTSGATTTIEDKGVLLTRRQLVIRRSAVETRTFELSTLVQSMGLEDGPISKDSMRRVVRAATRWGPILYYPFAVLGELVYRFLPAALLAVVGLVLCKLLGVTLAFGRVFTVALVTLVPLVLIESVAAVLQRPIGAGLAALVALAYLAFALSASRSSRPEAAPTA